jgi:alpha-galactosidase
MMTVSKGVLVIVAAVAAACVTPVQAQNMPARATPRASLSMTSTRQALSVWVDSLDLTKVVATRAPRPGQASIGRAGGGGRAAAGAPPPAPTPITLDGTVYQHGLGVPSQAEMWIDLKGQARQFTSTIGIDDARRTGRGSVAFEVWVDGKKSYDSGLIKSGDSAKKVSLSLTGAKTMILYVSDAGDGGTDDVADWGDAAITFAQSATPPQAIAPPVDPAPPIAASHTVAPRINSPRVTGATPGRPFQFLIPASGQGPLTFAAKNLPAGLTLDANTGIITGSLKAEGRTAVDVTVTGPKGKASAVITIVGGKDALALTPPLGWNSWNVWGGIVDDAKVRAAADAIVKSGLAAQGFTYVNIDDAWEGPRDANGEITSNEKFPNMKALADYVHSKGLKIGLYSSPGPRTCQQRYAGSYQHEEQDVKTWSKWGFDYIKYDWCSYSDVEPAAARSPLPALQKPYTLMRSLLDAADRDFVFSLCQYGWGNVWEWGDEVGGNLWRVTGDITDTWATMAGIGFQQTGHEKFAGPGHWNDTDMLVVGKVGWGSTLRDTRLTPNEQITHITLWTLQAAPLIIGADFSQIDEFTTNLLGNPEVLAVNQDPLGRAAGRTTQTGRVEVWSRLLSDGTMAVGLFNRDIVAQKISVTWSELGITGNQPVRDLWLQKDIGSARDVFSAEVPRHGAVLVKIGKPK